jgi:GWxTD domain-containing protein
MRMPVLILRPFVTLLLCSLAILNVPAQQTKRNPEEQPRRIKRELKKAYVDWIDDVQPILTQAERNAWTKLETDDEREKFIEDFWRSRDPDPDTEENEFKQEYFERVAYANEHFSSGKPGRLSDRGRIYIKFGKPDGIESHPAGGQYEREPWEGGGSTSTYPFEKWFYRYIPTVRSGVELEFVDPTGSGEYRLARNPNEKDALIHVPGAGPTLAELAGLENRVDRIAGLGGFGLANYRRAQDSPFEVMDLLVGLDRDLTVERDFIGASIHTPITDDSPLDFETQINYFKQSDNRVVTVLTLQTDNNQLSFSNSGGLEVARLNIFGNVMSVANRRVGKFEDSVTTTATAKELIEARNQKSAYAKAFILSPGRYRIDVVVRDIESGAAGLKQVAFVVPSFSADQLSASSIVLAAKLEKVEGGAPLGPFVIGTTKVVPNLAASYKRGQPVGVYVQIYNSAVDQTTLRPAVEAVYVLLKNGKELSAQTEDWRQINDAGQRLTLTRLIDSRVLEPGEYQIQIRIRDQVSGQSIAPSATFTILP